MGYLHGQATNLCSLLDDIIALCTNEGWEIVLQEDVIYEEETRVGTVLLKAKGDGNDNIYSLLRINPDDFNVMILDTPAGYDEHLAYWEQPGGLHQWNKIDEDNDTGKPMYSYTTGSGQSSHKVNVQIPSLRIYDKQRFDYFLFVNNYRLIIVLKLVIDYQSAYIGFLNPISSERQYPYPVYVAGNSLVASDNIVTGSFVFPTAGTGWLRRADGTWRSFEQPYSENISATTQGVLFPYVCNNKQLVPNFTNRTTTDVNFLLIPVLMYTNNPTDSCGLLREVFWISGTRDVAAEQIVVVDNVQYMVFDNRDMRGNNSYFCIKIEN